MPLEASSAAEAMIAPVGGCAPGEHPAAPPAGIVIFGASGDLTRRKLIPSLYALDCQGLLDDATTIVGLARSPWSDEEFRTEMRAAVAEHGRLGPVDDVVWARFSARLGYVAGDFEREPGYAGVGERLDAAGRENRLFYLATAPRFFAEIAERIRGSGLCAGGFSRLIVEKPFGTDLASARDLNDRLAPVFPEDDIFRIDHYLGKEAVQNLFVVRFANAIFEPLWNRHFIDNIQITVAEDLGVGSRGGYYDDSGALRDVLQNHLLQVLSLVAMEPPTTFAAREIRDEKVKVLRAITPLTEDAIRDDVVRGRYAGEGDVPGYLDEDGVPASSRTETFVAMKLAIDNWRWEGTPFYLRTGKRLARRTTEVVVRFRPAPRTPFPPSADPLSDNNLLRLRIQPDEGVALRMLSKVPGASMNLAPVMMDFAYEGSFPNDPPGAYERLLLDCLQGDATPFTRWDEVEEAWALLQPLLDAWEADPAGPADHRPGGWGPPAADELMARDGRRWLTR